MNLSGHLATAVWLARDSRRVPWERVVPIGLGALLPDLMDKSALYLGLTPFGRTVGHSLTFWGFALGLTLLARADFEGAPRTRLLRLVVTGGVSHLVVDLLDDVVEGLERSGYAYSAWYGWPHNTPDDFPIMVPHLFARQTGVTTSLEVVWVAFVCVVVIRDARRAAGSGAAS